MPNPSNLKERAKQLSNTAKKWHLHDPGFFTQYQAAGRTGGGGGMGEAGQE